MTLADIGEDELIRRVISLTPRPAIASHGPGDDCAVLDVSGEEYLLLKTDALVENIHHNPDEDARRVGWKAIARLASDFAAMGGRPSEYLVTLALPPETPLSWVEDLYRGMSACMDRHGGLLVGGETSAVPHGSARVIAVAGVGRVHKNHLVLRSGGRPGDLLLVTGTLGGSLAGRHLDFEPRLRSAQWLAEHARPHAMMDISDGLAKDLPRLAASSGCGFRLDREAIPITPGSSLATALTDGEDFELLLAVPQDSWVYLEKEWPREFPHLPLTAIGSLTAQGAGETLLGGWEHFQSAKLPASD